MPLNLERVTLNNTVGALFSGGLAAMFLFGITTLLTYWYYLLYPNDSRLHKSSVAVLWILDALHLALTIQAVYTYIVTGFGDLFGMVVISWSIKLQVLVNVVIILIVHSLYAHRMWILAEYDRGIVKYLVVLLIAGGFVIGVVLSYHLYQTDTYLELDNMSWVIIAAFSTVTGVDFLITWGMCYYLWKIRVAVSRLSETVSTIIQYTLGSGLITSAFSLSALFTYILLPDTLVFLSLEFLLTKIYCLSFLTMLHTRKRAVTLNPPSNDTDAGQPRVSIIQYMSRHYNALLNKLRSSSSSDASSQALMPINDKPVNSPSSGFRSPSLPGFGDGELHRLSAVDVESGPTFKKSDLSISDDSQTIRGVRMQPLTMMGRPSGNDIHLSPLQRPLPIYGRDPKLDNSFWTDMKVRPKSTC